MYSEFIGKLHFWVTFIGVNLICSSRSTSWVWPACRAATSTIRTPMRLEHGLLLGLVHFGRSACSSSCTACSKRLPRKREAGANPWGEGATTLEWTAVLAAAVPPVGAAAAHQIGAITRNDPAPVCRVTQNRSRQPARRLEKMSGTHCMGHGRRMALVEDIKPSHAARIRGDAARLFRPAQTARHVAGRLHRAGRASRRARQRSPVHGAVAILCDRRWRRRVGRAQHVVRCRHRRRDEPHGKAADPLGPRHAAKRRLVFGLILSVRSVDDARALVTNWVAAACWLSPSSSMPSSTRCG
jgi:hypothetical protein